MTIDEWIASLSPEHRAKLEVACSACALPSPASSIHFHVVAPNGTGQVWETCHPPVVFLLCDACRAQVTRETQLHELIGLSRRRTGECELEWFERTAQRVEQRKHLRVVE